MRRLLSKVFELGIKVKILLLDARYYIVDIINYLNGINFIMRAKGKFKEGDDLHNIQQEEQARGTGNCC